MICTGDSLDQVDRGFYLTVGKTNQVMKYWKNNFWPRLYTGNYYCVVVEDCKVKDGYKPRVEEKLLVFFLCYITINSIHNIVITT